MELIRRLKTTYMESKFHKFITETYEKIMARNYLPFVIFLYIIGFMMFFPTLVDNRFTIPVSGDFTLQEIPFYFNGYDDWWHFFKTGEFVLWDDSQMLGVNNIGANTFYYLFNPFFLVLLIVPRALIPQAQAFMMITKMVLCGVTMKMLLDYFKLKKETVWLFALSYAFCGYNFYYIWFNHFLEVAVLMPTIILGIEKVIKEQKPLFLIMAIFISGITNYNMLIAFCFTGAIYAAFRYFQNLKEYNIIAKKDREKKYRFLDVRIEVIVQGVFAFAIGLALTGFVLLPGFKVAMSNSRVSSATYLPHLKDSLEAIKLAFLGGGELTKKEAFDQFFKYIFDWTKAGGNKRNYIYPLVSFFTPNVSCMGSVIYDTYTYSYASMFVFTPTILFLIPSLIQAFKTRSVSTLIGVISLGFLAFTPFAYYCFSGFTNSAYGRWYIFLSVIILLFVAIQYDKKEKMSIVYLDLSFAVVVAIYGYLLYKGEQLQTKEIQQEIYYFYGELAYIVFLYIYLRKNFTKLSLTSDLKYFVAVEAIIMCNVTLVGQGTSTYQDLYGGLNNWKEETALAQLINEEDDAYFRTYSSSADRSAINLSMITGTKGLATFHSIFNYSLVDFLNWSTVQYNVSPSSWNMGIHEKRINLDQFLGVKYYFLKDNETNVPFGFHEYISTDDHVVYINDNFIELGYAFDNIINAEKVMQRYTGLYYSSDNSYTLTNEYAYLEGAIMYDEDIKELFGEDFEGNENFNYIKKARDLNADIVTALNYNTKGNRVRVFRKNGNNFEEREYTSANVTGLKYGSYLDINLEGLNVGSLCSTRGKAFVTVQGRMGENLNISLYGKRNDKEYLITSDTHMTHWFNSSKSGDSKSVRGFYVDDEVTRIKVEVKENMGNYPLIFPTVTYEYEDTYNQQIEKLKKSPLENVKMKTNSFSFETNYQSPKMVVSHIPYDEGWSLKVIDKTTNKIVDDAKIYKTQGGFLGTYADTGSYEYIFTYYTPGLDVGSAITYIGMLSTLTYAFASMLYDFSPRRLKYRFAYDFTRE